VNDPYVNVRQQIERGYLPLIISSSNTHLRLKNPDEKDFEWSSEVAHKVSWRQDIALISICVVSINGHMIEERERLEVLRYLEDISVSAKRHIFIRLLRHIEDARASYDYLEPFCYEDQSRYLWRSWKANQRFSNYRFDRLSSMQINWVLWNETEDERISQKEEWDRTFFSASAMNSSVPKIKDKWVNADKQEAEYREKIMEGARTGNLNKVEEAKDEIRKKKSYDDLRGEMTSWVKGEEDEHDRIVNEYKETMRRQIRDAQERVVKMAMERQARQRDLSELENRTQPIVALSEEQVQNLLQKRSRPGTINLGNEGADRVIDRYLLAQEDKGQIELSDDGSINPTNSSLKKDLMEQIAGRKPTL